MKGLLSSTLWGDGCPCAFPDVGKGRKSLLILPILFALLALPMNRANACDNLTSGGTIGYSHIGCGPSYDPPAFTNVSSPSGGYGTIEYMWLSSTTGCPPENGMTVIPGANKATYNSGPLTQTTWFRRCARRSGCTDWVGESNCIMVEVVPSPTVSAGFDQTICAGEYATLSASAFGGSGGGYTYTWSDGLGAGQMHTASPGATKTYYVTVTDSNGCTGVDAVTVNVANDCCNLNSRYRITDSDPLCSDFNGYENGVFYQRNCGGAFTVWKAGPDLILTENTDGTANITGSVISNGTVGIVNIGLSNYGTSGQGWTNVCYTNNLSADYYYRNFSGTISIDGTVYTIVEKPGGEDFILGQGANNENDNDFSIGAWASGTWGSCVEMFGNLTPLGGISVSISEEAGCQSSVLTANVSGESQNCSCSVDSPARLAYWNLNSCVSNSGDGSNADYSEFTATTKKGGCTDVSASSLDRVLGNHSCTPAYAGAAAMCIGTQQSCDPDDYNDDYALTFSVTLSPSDIGQVTSLSFYEKAPTTYDWIGGASGSNDYPTKYLIKVFKDGQLIYEQDEISTTQGWTLESFNFTNNPSFKVESPSTFTFKLRAYCRVGNGASQSVWDLDEIKVFGGCCTAPSGSSYVWSNGATSATISASQAGNYSVTVTDCAGCTATDMVTVADNGVNANAGPDQTICVGATTTLTASGGGSYQWSTGASTASIVVGPGTYTVTVTKDGCSDTDSVVVGTFPAVNADAGPNQTICAGNSATLTASGGGSYQWSTGATTASISVSPMVTTSYSVTVSSNGCTDVDMVTVYVNNIVANAGPDQTICPGATATLTASGGTGYQWSTGANTASIQVGPGTYTVTATSNGCTDTDQVVVTADPNGQGCSGYVDLEVSKSADKQTFQQGDHVYFTVTITNVGTVAATNVVVADAKPAGVAYGGYTATQGVYSDWLGTWDIGTIQPGATHTLTLDWYMQQGTSAITNFAQVKTASPDDIDSTPGNNTTGVPSEDDEASVTVTPPGGGTPMANLSLNKTVSQNLVSNGDQIYYTVTVNNAGPDTATGVTVEDVLPAGLSFNSASATLGSYNSGTGIWNAGSLASGASQTLTINVTVTNIGSGITNFAQVETASPGDPNSTPGNDTNGTPNEDDEDDATITPAGSTPYVDLELSKTASTLYFSQYDMVTFTVTIVNNGNTTASNVVVKDPKPAGVAYGGYTASKGVYSDWSGTWTIGTLAPGETHTLNLEWFMQQGANPITNFAQVQTATPNDIDSTPGNNYSNTPNEDDEASVTILPQGADPCLAYTCHATVTQQISSMGACDGMATAGASSGSGSYGYMWSNGATSQSISNLCAGTYTVTITDGNGCVCTSSVTLSDADPGPICETRTVNNSQACAAFGFEYAFYSADLFEGVTAGVDYAVQNGTFTEYANGTARLVATFVNNDNPNVIFQADVIFTGRTFTPPATSPYLVTCGNSYVPDPSDWYYYPDFSGTFVGQGDIAGLVMDVHLIEHSFQIGTGANLSDQFLYGSAAWMDYVVVTPPNNSGITINANSRTDFNFRLTGDDLTCIDLSLDKSASVAQAVVGDQFVYTVTVSNDGPGTAYDVTVEDVLPAGLTYGTSSATQGSYSAGTGLWTVGTLANGGSAELDITVTVNSISGSITNFAQVETATPDDYDSTPGNDTNGTPDEDDEASVTITEGSSCSPLTSGGQIGSNETGCGPSFDPAPITNISSPSGGSGTIEYQWLVSTVGCPSSTNAYQVIAGATGATYDPGSITQTTYYRRRARRAGCTSWSAGESNCVVKTVESCGGGDEIDLEVTKTANTTSFEKFDRVLFTVTIVNNGPGTATGVTVADAKPAGVAFVGATASQGTYSDWQGLWNVGTLAPGQTETLVLDWFMQQDVNLITNFAQVQSADQTDVDSAPGNNAGNTPAEDDEAAVTITPGSGGCDNVTNAGQIGPDQSGCGPFDPVEIGSISLPSGGSGAIEYQWLSSTSGCPTLSTQAIAGANGPTYNPGSLTETTWFRRCSRRAGCTDWVGESNCVIVTVEDCSGGCDNITNAGQIGNDETGCGPSFDPAAIVSVVDPSGGTGTIEYVWLASTSGCPSSISQAIPGANGSTYNPGPITQTTYYRRCSRRVGCSLWNESNCIVKTVEDCGGSGIDLELTKTANTTTFNRFDHVTFTVTVTNKGPQTATGVTVADVRPAGTAFIGYTASKGTYSDWFGLWTVGTLAPNESATLNITWFMQQNVNPITNFAQVKAANEDDSDSTPGNNTTGVPSEDDEASVTVTPQGYAECDNVTNGGQIGYDETGCGQYDPAEIVSISLPSGGAGTIQYMWLSSTTGCPNQAGQAIAGANGPSYNPGPITQTTWYRRCSRRAGCTDWVGESNCIVKTVDNGCETAVCQQSTIDNTPICAGGEYAFYASDLFLGISEGAYYTVVNGTFTEYTDGTAQLTATYSNTNLPSVLLDVVINLSGKTAIPPDGSPYNGVCGGQTPFDTSDWYYYTELSGTITGQGDVAGAEIQVVSYMHSFQIGTGASLRDEFVFGASAWMEHTIISQPTNTSITLNASVHSDVNFNLSGDATACRPAVCQESTMSNTPTCSGNSERAFTANDLFLGISEGPYYTLVNGAFTEYADGTAQLIASFSNIDLPNVMLDAVINLSGRTTVPLDGDPFTAVCNGEAPDPSDWYYYTELSGTFTGQGDVAGAEFQAASYMHSFQIGTGASLRDIEFTFGASAWLEHTIISQPTNTGITINAIVHSDLTFNLSGDVAACVCDNVTSAGEIAGSETGCAPSYDPAAITSVSLPSGGSGDLEYVWLSSTDNSLPVSQWDVIAGATAATYNPGAISATTYFIRCSRRSGCTAYVGESNIITKTVETCSGGGSGADLQIAQTAAQTTFSKFQHVFFTVTLTNNGPETATNITVKNVKPTGTNYGGDTPSQGTYSNWSGIWTVGNLASGASAVLELDWFTMVDAGVIVNFAQVWSTDVADPNSTPGNNATTVPAENDEAAVTITATTAKAESVYGFENGLLKLMPVPARHYVEAEFIHVNDGQSTIRVYDMTGKLVIGKEVYLPEGYNRVRIETDMLPDGMYMMTILNGSETVAAKFYKSK